MSQAKIPVGSPAGTNLQSYQHLPVERVHFGEGSVKTLTSEVETRGLQKVLVLASASLSEAIDGLAPVREAIGDSFAGLHVGAFQHCPISAVLDAAQRARDSGCDGIVTAGGSSVHDLAKGVALCLAEDITDEEGLRARRVLFEFPDKVTMPAPIGGQPVPIICIPTTLSAGETTSGVGITNRDGLKDIYFFSELTPRVVIYDPALTVHTPERLWLSSGMRAVDHCVESLYSPTAQPVTDALCSDALWRLARYLPSSRQDPTDLGVRMELQVAAWMSYFGLSNALSGLSHALGHAIGTSAGVPHGITSCTILPSAMEWNLPATGVQQRRIADILAPAMETAPDSDAASLVRLLVERLGLPGRLQDAGVTREQLDVAAELAISDMLLPANPRPVSSKSELRGVLEAAY